jgi:hypothetical protein
MELDQIRTRIHEVKAYSDNFHLMSIGQKPFDVRRDDRLYERGDIIVFKEYDPTTETYSGAVIKRLVTCKQIWEGLSPGYCALGLAEVPNSDSNSSSTTNN